MCAHTILYNKQNAYILLYFFKTCSLPWYSWHIPKYKFNIKSKYNILKIKQSLSEDDRAVHTEGQGRSWALCFLFLGRRPWAWGAGGTLRLGCHPQLMLRTKGGVAPGTSFRKPELSDDEWWACRDGWFWREWVGEKKGQGELSNTQCELSVPSMAGICALRLSLSLPFQECWAKLPSSWQGPSLAHSSEKHRLCALHQHRVGSGEQNSPSLLWVGMIQLHSGMGQGGKSTVQT